MFYVSQRAAFSSILATVMIASCSGVVAPSTTQNGSANKTGAVGAGDQTSQSAPSNVSGATPVGSDTTAEGSVAADAGSILGTITDEKSTGWTFAGKSVYALQSVSAASKSLMIMVSDTEYRDIMFKAIKEWKCHDCVGDNDPNCTAKTSTTTTTTLPQTVNIMFAAPMSTLPAASLAQWKVDTSAFPTQDTYTLAGDITKDYVMGINVSSGQMTTPSGSVKFTTRPAKVGDAFKAALSFNFAKDKKQYSATIEGKVYTIPANNPLPPAECTLANKKWPEAIFQ